MPFRTWDLFRLHSPLNRLFLQSVCFPLRGNITVHHYQISRNRSKKKIFHLRQVPLLLRNEFILLVGFFLFCQSSFEAIINNWTTTYLIQKLSDEPKARHCMLFRCMCSEWPLCVYSSEASSDVLRRILIVKISFLFLLLGCLLLWLSNVAFHGRIRRFDCYRSGVWQRDFPSCSGSWVINSLKFQALHLASCSPLRCWEI